MSKITINEQKLNQIISESIKRHINELTSGFMDNAASAALKKGRYSQARNFGEYRDDLVNQETGADKFRGDVEMQYNFIRYKCYNGNMVTVKSSGSIGSQDLQRTWFTFDEMYETYGGLKSSLKTSDKRVARTIAKWIAQCLDENVKAAHPELTDWHTWCCL